MFGIFSLRSAETKQYLLLEPSNIVSLTHSLNYLTSEFFSLKRSNQNKPNYFQPKDLDRWVVAVCLNAIKTPTIGCPFASIRKELGEPLADKFLI